MQCRNINFLVQSTFAAWSLSLFSRPAFFRVNDGQTSIATLTIFCLGNSIAWIAFFTHLKIPSPVVLSFIDSIDSCSSVISKFSEMPCTKMSSCTVSSMSVLSSTGSENCWNEITSPSNYDVRSSPIALMQQAKVLLNKFPSNFCLCCRQTKSATLSMHFLKIHHHQTVCCV